MNKTPPDPIPRARARARLWLRRGPATRAKRVGTITGSYRVTTRGGSVLHFDIRAPGERSTMSRTRAAGSEWLPFDSAPVPIYRWEVELDRPVSVGVPRGEAAGYAYVSPDVVLIEARYSRHPACGSPLLRGRCLRCLWLRGSWWVTENHHDGVRRPIWWRKRVYNRVLNPILDLLERL